MKMLENHEIVRIAKNITQGMEEPERGWSLLEAASACVYWCIIHKGWRDGSDLGMTKKAAKDQLHEGPLSNRPIGAIEPKVMNVTAVAQKLLADGLPIYNLGRYTKRTTGKDLGPMVCKGFAPADNYQSCLNEILPRAIEYFDLLETLNTNTNTNTDTEDYFIDPSNDEVRESDHSEGRPIKYLGTRYERDPKARSECLEHWGYSCQVCGLNFRDRYGEIGHQFIHVHHLNPVAATGAISTNPIYDLRPVCPNCHAMLHKKHPPYQIEELKEIIKIG